MKRQHGFGAIEAILIILLLLLLGFIFLNVVKHQKNSNNSTDTGNATASILGTGLTPANTPNSSQQDIQNFFDLAAEIGSHIRVIKEWKDNPGVEEVEKAMQAAHKKGLGVHLYLSPISLDKGRQQPAIPAALGKSSFADSAVRAAFKAKALEFASLKPDILGIGTEVNFLSANPNEFANYVSLAKETYQAVKAEYPSQDVTISFQWDQMVRQGQHGLLEQFKGSLDVYSFTSYPSSVGSPASVPASYYSDIKTYLPNQRIGIAEIGWSSAAPSSEQQQADFFARLPEFFATLKPEYVTLALMHDVNAFGGELNNLNSAGVRHYDGSPKPSWDVVAGLVL